MVTRILGFALMVLSSAPARANPCAAAQVDGRQILPPDSMRDVYLVDERIQVTLRVRDGNAEDRHITRKEFRISYLFDNRGEATHEVVIGFPIVIPALGRPRKGVLAGFRVRGRGVGRRVAPTKKVLRKWMERSFLDRCEKAVFEDLKKGIAMSKTDITFGDDDIAFTSSDDLREPYRVGWYFWRQRFGRGKTRLTIGYEARDVFGGCAVGYVLRTAKYWGDGTIGRLTVDLTVRPSRQAYGISALPLLQSVDGRKKAKAPPRKATPTKRGAGRLRWRWQRLKTKRDLVITLKGCAEG